MFVVVSRLFESVFQVLHSISSWCWPSISGESISVCELLMKMKPEEICPDVAAAAGPVGEVVGVEARIVHL